MDRFKTLESFVAVAKCGSYSLAAKQFGVSRALMSRKIMELEARVGERLLNRNTHRLSLTEAGQSYFESCQSILSELESAELSLIERRKVARGSLRVLTSQTFGYVHMGQVAAAFMRRYPDIDVFVMSQALARQTMDLVGGGFDIALRTTDLADSSLIARKIVRLDWFLVGAPDYLGRHGAPGALHDLIHHKCLITGNEPNNHWDLESSSGAESVRISGIPISNLTMLTRAAASAGLGIALLPEYCIAPDLATGALVRLFPEYKGKERWLRAVYSKERKLPLKLRLFIDFLEEWFRDHAWSDLAAT